MLSLHLDYTCAQPDNLYAGLGSYYECRDPGYLRGPP